VFNNPKMPTLADTSEFRDADAPGSRSVAPPSGARGMRRILVCLDRSTCSEACLPYAISLARVFESTVTLLYVMQPLQEHSGTRITDPLGWEVSRREASAYLDRLAKEASEAWGLRVDSRIEQGRPAERITAIAREIGADLTVIASHGEGGVAAWNLGSTAQQVLAVSRGSVLVARSALPCPSVIAPKRILVPLDGSLRTESVLPTATRIADAHGAELLLVHVVSEPLPTAVLHAGDLDLARDLATRLELRAKRYLDHLRARLPRDTRVRTLVTRHVDERQSLLEISRQEQIDLVVLSAHGSVCNPARSFGSVTHHLLSHSMVPLLVLQDLSDPELERVGEEGEEQAAPALRASYPPGEG
jgi:nucleotide-binding universal stress UspA family protein